MNKLQLGIIALSLNLLAILVSWVLISDTPQSSGNAGQKGVESFLTHDSPYTNPFADTPVHAPHMLNTPYFF